jgi:hypothetical protein
MHERWRTFLEPQAAAGRPDVTVAAIVDHGAGAPLDPTLRSLGACPAIRRVVVLNRGGETLTVTNVDLLNEGPEALDGELAAVVEDNVLLIHSGVTLVPDAFDTMVRALASTDLDGLLPAGRIIHRQGSRVVPPLGGSAAFSLFEGVTFTGAMLVRRAALDGAKAGRAWAADSPFLGLADFCVARNGRIWPYPETVAERAADCPIEAKSALPARVEAYGDASASDRAYMLAAGYGAANGTPRVGYKRKLALAAMNIGLAPLVRIASGALRRFRRWTS